MSKRSNKIKVYDTLYEEIVYRLIGMINPEDEPVRNTVVRGYGYQVYEINDGGKIDWYIAVTEDGGVCGMGWDEDDVVQQAEIFIAQYIFEDEEGGEYDEFDDEPIPDQDSTKWN